MLAFLRKYSVRPPIGIPASYLLMLRAIFSRSARDSLYQYLKDLFPGYDVRLFEEGRQAFGFLLETQSFKTISIQSLTCPVMIFEAAHRGVMRVQDESAELMVKTVIWGKSGKESREIGASLMDACQIYPSLLKPEDDYILLSFNESKPAPGFGGGALLCKSSLKVSENLDSRVKLSKLFRGIIFRFFQKLVYTPFLYAFLKKISAKKIGSTYSIESTQPDRPVLMSNFKAFLALKALKDSAMLKKRRDSLYLRANNILAGNKKYSTSYELGYTSSHQYFLLPKKEYQTYIESTLDDCGISFFQPHRYDLEDLDDLKPRVFDRDLRFAICLPMNFSENESQRLLKKIRQLHEKV